jgi:hypothetical protein
VEWWNVTPAGAQDYAQASEEVPPACRIVPDPDLETVSRFGVSLSPTVYFIDSSGIVAAKLEGYVSDGELTRSWQEFASNR